MITFNDLEKFLNEGRNELIASISAFQEDELHLTEYEGGWAVPQVVEHLALVESYVVYKVEKMLNRYPLRPSEPLADKVVDVVELFRAIGIIGKRNKAPKEVQPSGNLSLQDGLMKLHKLREQLKGFLPELAQRETNGNVSYHPLGTDLNICQWVHFAAIHEIGHIRQLKRIRQAADSPIR